MADYGCFPVWEAEGVRQGCDVDPATLPISVALRSALLDWAGSLDLALDWDDPAATVWRDGFWADFNQRGGELAGRMRDELGPEYQVQWAPWGEDPVLRQSANGVG